MFSFILIISIISNSCAVAREYIQILLNRALRVAFLLAIFFPFEGINIQSGEKLHIKLYAYVGDSILRTGVRPRKKFANSCIYTGRWRGRLSREQPASGINSPSKNWYNLARRDHRHQALPSLTTLSPSYRLPSLCSTLGITWVFLCPVIVFVRERVRNIKPDIPHRVALNVEPPVYACYMLNVYALIESTV